jgi:homocysteine S-methyltransferase
MRPLLDKAPFILMEAAIVEQLRRSGKVRLHDSLLHAPFIYDPDASEIMRSLYAEYIDLAHHAGLPILICTPTWRANKSRVEAAHVRHSINSDSLCFMRKIREAATGHTPLIKIGGLIGCKNDCYRPEEGLSALEAQQFHAWQIDQLAAGGADFLIAETLPAVQEALGIARAMETTRLPYIISFVIARNGHLLDGTALMDAIDFIDTNTTQPPLGYMINCAHPSFLLPGSQPKALFSRLIGFQANASSLDHCALDKADQLQVDSIPEWGKQMLELHHAYGLKILGGCCGTSAKHLQYLVQHR